MKINRSSINKLRTKDFLLTLLALAFLFIGVPGYVSLLNNWNSNVANEGTYSELRHENFANHTVTWPSMDEDPTSYGIITGEWYEDAWTVSSQMGIVWTNETAENHTLVLFGDGDIYGPYWITPWRISDLINNGTTSFHIRMKLPRNMTESATKFRAYYINDDGDKDIVMSGPAPCGKLYAKDLQGTDEFDVYINTSTIDLLVDQAENGNDRLIFGIDNFYSDCFESGDIIEFRIFYYVPSSTEIDENTALKWGGLAGGVILGIIAIGSTSLWNPLDKSNPGWIDIQIKKLFNRRKK